MKKSLQIITIGSIFLLCGASFFGIVSLKDEGVSSGFWTVRQLVMPTTFADRDDDNDNDNDNNNNDDDDNDDDDNNNDDNNNTPVVTPTTPVVTPTTPVVTPTTPVVTPTQTCTTVYDTVTNASGTAEQVPRQVCTTTPTTPSVPVTPTTPVVTPIPTPTTPVTPTVVSTPVVTPVSTPTTSQYRDGTYTGVGRYSFAGGSVDYSVSVTISSGWISQASFINFTASGNGKFTRTQGDAILQNIVNTDNTNIDTVTGATGTSQAVQDAINDALSKARTSSPTPTTVTPIVPQTSNTPVPTSTNSVSPTKYTAPNGKKYTVHPLSTGAFIFERPDGTFSSMKFSTYKNATSFIALNNPNIQEINLHTAPNGKQYTIMSNVTDGTFFFRRSDGTSSSREFATKNAVIAFINANNPYIIKKSITASIPKKTTPSIKISTVKKTTPKTVTAKPTPSASSSANTTLSAQAKAQAEAQAQAQAAAAAAQATVKPVIQVPTPAPKVDTTTAAS